jgi:glycosyltransferase involved in cell wall biosynthesis
LFNATMALVETFRKRRIDVVLAEFGPTGVLVGNACRIAGLPLVVHFHGYDATRHKTLTEFGDAYREMFAQASAVIAVSKRMERSLLDLGAHAETLHLNPCGVDCSRFSGARPAEAPPLFVAVGRFVEKKAPHLTLLAFARAVREMTDMRLRMFGDGPLLGPCRQIAEALGIAEKVEFAGATSHDVVKEQMRAARAFVQHSIEASDGDCEGTPVAVLEAGASGLPVIATRHAGIPDVVVERETGLLVDELDVEGMSQQMLELARHPDVAGRLGAAAADRVRRHFTSEISISRLWSIIEGCI